MENAYQSLMKINIDKHIGEWLAISNQKIIASGSDFKTAYKKAKIISKQPFVVRIPDKETRNFVTEVSSVRNFNEFSYSWKMLAQ